MGTNRATMVKTISRDELNQKIDLKHNFLLVETLSLRLIITNIYRSALICHLNDVACHNGTTRQGRCVLLIYVLDI